MRWSSLKLSLLVVLSFSMSLILASFLFYKNITLLLGFWGEETKVSFYLKTDTTEEAKNKLLEQIKAEPDIALVSVVDRTEAAADFKKMFGEYSAGMISVDEMIDLIPESLVVTLKKTLSTEEKSKTMMALKDSYVAHPEVEEITSGGEWVHRFSKLDRALRAFGLVLFLVLSLSVCFISALMVRSLIDDSKSEIEVLSLIGATRWHIYQKYMKQFIYFFTISVVSSIALTAGVYSLVKNKFLMKQSFVFIAESLSFLNAPEIAGLLGILFLFVLAGASLSLKSTIQRLNLFAND